MSKAYENKIVTFEKELVPLVEAKPVSEAVDQDFDLAGSRTSGTIAQEPIPIPRAKVKVIAPSNLPPGYRLSIKYHDEGGKTVNGYCRVPNGGVYRGDQFEAEILPPRVITGRWAIGVFECCGSVRDNAFLMVSICGSVVAWGCLYEAAFQKPSGSCWGLLLLMLLLHSYFSSLVDESGGDDDNPNLEESDLASLLSFYLLVFMTAIVAFIRWRIRQKYQIPGNGCEDCLCVFFCSCCSAMQAYHHMDLAHDAPRMGKTVSAERTGDPKGVMIV